MGNICFSHTVVHDPAHFGTNSRTGTVSPNADTSSKFTGFSQEKSSLESSNGSTPSEYSHNSHSTRTNLASLKAFSFNDLRAATRNFRPESVLGEGGFGIVYKGYVDEHTLVPSRVGHGMIIAIKKLKLEGSQGHREWLAEVHYLGALHHPNLVRLIGFCAEDSNRLLVYEYMPRGSLENHLFRKGRYGPTLSWDTRMKIAMGAAKGLSFLHNAERQVIYRDFKASNILLDVDCNAKLSDFGLAKDGPMGDETHVSTRIIGTYGYAAPEYLATGHLSAKSDVYSFGVVLLELLTGLKTVDNNRPSGEEKLVDWAKPQLGGKRQVMRIVDERLQGHFSSRAVYKIAQLALRCIDDVAKSRPLMKEVVEYLEQLPVCTERTA